MEIIKDKYRVFVLGAGFSKPTGLPLCAELFTTLLRIARRKYRHVEKFVLDDDLEKFIKYQRRARNRELTENDINLEDFISYLDLEHFLRLKGKDHWSEEGNLSQIYIKNLIAHILYDRECQMGADEFRLYEKFAEKLKPGDLIITFNYDTILEKTFARKKIPYSLVPVGFEENNLSQEDKIVLLKMHGSIDWFDYSVFERTCEWIKKLPGNPPVQDSVFAREGTPLHLEKIIEKPVAWNSPLNKIYGIEDLGDYLYTTNWASASPLIISPSHSKLIHVNPLIEFWHGYSSTGGGNGTVTIIGFSLPTHDEYIRQPLYHLVDNFQNNNFYKDILVKTNLKMIDYKTTSDEILKYKENYSFVDWDRTDCYFNGFNEESLDVIFE